jgi:hypothetical protein
MASHLQIKSYSPELYTEEHIAYSESSWIIQDLFVYTQARTQIHAYSAGFTTATVVGFLRTAKPVETIILASACVYGIYLYIAIYHGRYVYMHTGRSQYFVIVSALKYDDKNIVMSHNLTSFNGQFVSINVDYILCILVPGVVREVMVW